MQGMRILDKVQWHGKWSSDLGEKFGFKDSSNDLFIFEERYGREEIRTALQGIPEELYQHFEVEEASEEDCDYRGDSGRCYRKIQ